jgi:two-component system, NtrC family, nitrogen regulation sensor histidine kinase NtrY
MKVSGMLSNRYGTSFLLGSILLVSVIYILHRAGTREEEPLRIRDSFQQIYLTKEKVAEAIVKSLAHDSELSEGRHTRPRTPVDQARQEGLSLLVFKQDSLIYWSDNTIPLPKDFLTAGTGPLTRLKNGWYRVFRENNGPVTVIGMMLIKHEYPFRNEYLENNFQKQFNIHTEVNISEKRGSYNIFCGDGTFLCSLQVEDPERITRWPALQLALFLGGVVLFFAFLYRIYSAAVRIFRRPPLFIAAFAAVGVILRVIQYGLKWPAALYDTPLFGPDFFFSSWLFPSLGDFLLNALLLLILSYVFFLRWNPSQQTISKHYIIRLLLEGVALLVSLASWGTAFWLTYVLVVNSSIPMNLQNISGLRLISAPAFLIVAMLFSTAYLVNIKLVEYAASLTPQKAGKRFSSGFSPVLVFIVISALAATAVLNYANRRVENEKRKILAMKLATRRNPVTEVMYLQAEARMKTDSNFLRRLAERADTTPESRETSLSQSLIDRYFRGYWTGYTLQATLCEKGELLRIQPRGYLTSCNDYFDGIIRDFGQPTSSPNLFYLDYGYGSENYLGVVQLPGGNDRIIIEFNAKPAFQDLGYPELLVDKSQSVPQEISDYSYAYYQSGQLVQRVGKFPYGFRISKYSARTDSLFFFSSDGMDHLLYPVGGNNVLLVSKPEPSFLTAVSPFSYLFIFFSLFAVAFFCLVSADRLQFISISTLRNRLQVSVLGIILSSFIIIGVVLMVFLVRLNTEKDKESLLERALSILVEMQHKFGSTTNLRSEGSDELANTLVKYSNVFFSDIHLYDPEGVLLATSRPEIFEEGLLSDLMNRNAFDQLRSERTSMFVQEERIGKHQYYSAYLPMYNDRNVLVGFINLPYFSRQSDLKQEISAFLIAFVNIYVLFILTGLFAAFITARYITAPLKLLASKIGTTRLGSMNEKIDWRRRDEIGRLVEEYNRMLDELAGSVEKLAISERESAWREMARQVAHEIKNPLTPMKLSVQHLQKAWEEKTPDWDQRLRRFTASMAEQIDSLSRISSEFSDFAKMPDPVNEPLDLAELISSAMYLYREVSGVHIIYEAPAEQMLVMADRKQLLRVINNLMNNAIQAISHDHGEIEINLSSDTNRWIIRIRDNGPGIPEDQAERIFQPNFTTKSGGTGLGLAIVREIISAQGGDIHFESAKGRGTTFIITLPAYNL